MTAPTPDMIISLYLAFRLVWDFVCLDSNCWHMAEGTADACMRVETLCFLPGNVEFL
ncbi:hypothetical protein FDG2_4243 [Candidatus Protofrankia californiensis]|uniref:Uncharacterized protein n=1 Tax=Candidatus Protofrankia californiensis TaxID=1839754 RepID=A0A1C3P4B5_9ACTN|nr:hypothetical protein FDG2_4243 [Candidatus Protofrankia californiensis]